MKGTLLFHVCGFFLTLFSAILSYFSFFIDPTGAPHEITTLLCLLGGMAVCYLMASLGIALGRMRIGIASVLLWALVARACLFSSLPILETDPNRYLWDGYVLLNGINPYQFAPQTILDPKESHNLSDSEKKELETLRQLIASNKQAEIILRDVNNPEVITIYPPFTQILFGITAWFHPLSLYAWRCTILLFDALLIAALVILLPRMRRDPALVIFYAWSPLVLKEYINTLHFDIIALALLFLGIVFAISSHTDRSAGAFACGGLTKLFPIPVFPLWIKRFPIRTTIVFLLVTLFLTIPFLAAGSRGASGLAVFANRWESNGSLVVFLEWILTLVGVPAWGEGKNLLIWQGVRYDLDAFLCAKILSFVVFIIVWPMLAIKTIRQKTISDERRLARSFSVIAVLLVCSPVCNPWYIAWVTPFLCFFPRTAWLYLSISCFLHYSIYSNDPWAYPWWSRPAEYGPALVLLMWEYHFGAIVKIKKRITI